jgi:hypothetical protein
MHGFGTFLQTRLAIEAAMEQYMSGSVTDAKAALDDAANKSNDTLEEYNSTQGGERSRAPCPGSAGRGFGGGFAVTEPPHYLQSNAAHMIMGAARFARRRTGGDCDRETPDRDLGGLKTRLSALAALLAAFAAGVVLLVPGARSQVRALVRPEPPPRITPLALRLPTPSPPPTAQPTASPAGPTARLAATAALAPTEAPSPTPEPTPTPGPVEVEGRTYDAYIAAASKEHQTYKYSCEFDAAWVILQTYGVDVSVDDLVAAVGVDTSIEPWIEETKDGFLVHGGDITSAFSGNIRENFLARSTGAAMRKAFERYGLGTAPVHDRAGVEAALRAGRLIWIKTTVDFKPWRPATWVMADGRTRQTVLGNDHAVVVMGFSERGVVIRDVLGPTSSNWQRPYEYEVGWDAFLAAWGAQEFDGLAVAPPLG